MSLKALFLCWALTFFHSTGWNTEQERTSKWSDSLLRALYRLWVRNILCIVCAVSLSCIFSRAFCFYSNKKFRIFNVWKGNFFNISLEDLFFCVSFNPLLRLLKVWLSRIWLFFGKVFSPKIQDGGTRVFIPMMPRFPNQQVRCAYVCKLLRVWIPVVLDFTPLQSSFIVHSIFYIISYSFIHGLVFLSNGKKKGKKNICQFKTSCFVGYPSYALHGYPKTESLLSYLYFVF